jgi:hypothetical protein
VHPAATRSSADTAQPGIYRAYLIMRRHGYVSRQGAGAEAAIATVRV